MSLLRQVVDVAVEELHVTLMVSRATPHRQSLNEMLEHFETPCVARVTRLVWINGHDKRGYVLAELDSLDVHDRHDLLVKIGCTPRWNQFYPHLTLAKDVRRGTVAAALVAVNTKLAAARHTLELEGTVFEDLM